MALQFLNAHSKIEIRMHILRMKKWRNLCHVANDARLVVAVRIAKGIIVESAKIAWTSLNLVAKT